VGDGAAPAIFADRCHGRGHLRRRRTAIPSIVFSPYAIEGLFRVRTATV
jgi:hypothetical protein